jgi:putative membrane protein
VRLLFRWVVVALAIFVAVQIVPGITVDTTNSSAVVLYAVVAIVLGLVNAIIRPILIALTCPLQILTLGLGIFVVNAVCFWFAGWAAQNLLSVPFEVHGFLAALLGSIVVSVVSAVLGVFVPD